MLLVIPQYLIPSLIMTQIYVYQLLLSTGKGC